MIRVAQNIGHALARTAIRHPAISLGLLGVGVLALVAFADGTGKNALLPAGPGGLQRGPLPAGTTGETSHLSNAFFVRLEQLAQHFRDRGANITAEDLMAMMLSESGVDPRVGNPIGCMGLNQICNLKGVGWTGTGAEYLALPGEQQLEFVQRYFDNVNRYPAIRNYGSLYLANFNPGHLGKPDDFVLYRQGQREYDLNRGIDAENKGFINIADMAKFVERSVRGRQKRWNELRMRLQKATGASLVAGVFDQPIGLPVEMVARMRAEASGGACILKDENGNLYVTSPNVVQGRLPLRRRT